MEIGSIIGGKYQLTRPIGRGGMGTVFEATHTQTGERYAVKVLFESKSKEDDSLKIERFEREALAIGKLDTPHVVRVFDSGIDGPTQQPYIVMEVLQGEDVSHLLKHNGPLPVETALAIVAQACAGLYKAHEAGIVHRDIKPGNLFVSRADSGENVVKLLDFGIAKVRKIDDSISSELGTITETGTLVGSPYYMSPEQAKGLKTVDHRADIWSLGVVLYKCLTGRTPYDHHSTLGQVIIAVCGEDAPSVHLQAPWVPPQVAAILERALQRNVATRFQNAYEMYEAIRPLLVNGGRITDDMLVPLPPELRAQLSPSLSQSGPILAVDTGAPHSHPQALSHTPPATFGMTTPGAPPAKKGRGLAIALALFAVLALGTFAAGLFVKLASRAPTTAVAAPPSVTSASSTPPVVASSVAIVETAQPTATPIASASTKPSTTSKPTVKPAAHAQPSQKGNGRLQGGVGSDVPF